MHPFPHGLGISDRCRQPYPLELTTDHPLDPFKDRVHVAGLQEIGANDKNQLLIDDHDWGYLRPPEVQQKIDAVLKQIEGGGAAEEKKPETAPAAVPQPVLE